MEALQFPVNYTVKNPRLWEFHNDRGRIQERGLFGGTGGGKTYGACAEDIHITLTEPAGVGILAAPDYPSIKRAYYPTLAKLLGKPLDRLEPLVRFNRSEHRLDWANGWTWWFVSMDKPNAVEGIPEAVFIHLTEARLLRGFADEDGPWLNLLRRLRGEKERDRYAIVDTHSPTREIHEYFTAANKPGRQTYSWSTMDAAKWGTLSARDAAFLASGYTGSAALRVLHGQYARPTGLVYDAYDEARNRQTWIRKEPDRWTYGVDPGWTHPAVVTAHAWSGETVHTVREVALEKPGTSGIAKAVLALMQELGEGTVYVGPDVRASDIVEDLKARGVPAQGYTGRVQAGIDLLNGRLKDAVWLIDPSCTEVLRQMDLYEWKKGSVDEPEKGDEDALDSCRYGILGGGSQHRGGAW